MRLSRPSALHPALLGTLALSVVLVAGCGSDKDSASGSQTQTINVSMTDNEFTPDSFQVDKGTTVTFRFTNDGMVDHEAVIGSETEQLAHEDEMNPGKGMGDTSTTEPDHMTTTSMDMDHDMHGLRSGGTTVADDDPSEMHGGSDHMGETDDLDAVTVHPGKTKTLTHTFDKAGTVILGCHEAGHYKTMKATITVS